VTQNFFKRATRHAPPRDVASWITALAAKAFGKGPSTDDNRDAESDLVACWWKHVKAGDGWVKVEDTGEGPSEGVASISSDDESDEDDLSLATFAPTANISHASGSNAIVPPVSASAIVETKENTRLEWIAYGSPLCGTMDDDVIQRHLCRSMDCHLRRCHGDLYIFPHPDAARPQRSVVRARALPVQLQSRSG
jgi:hypothetical protein